MASPLPINMRGVLLNGHGGIEQLEYREDIPLPRPKSDEVLVRLRAAAINNTDINTRSGWYDSSVKVATGEGGETGFSVGSTSAANPNPNSNPNPNRSLNALPSSPREVTGAQGNSGDLRSWSGDALSFPFIQGADGCGEIVSVGALVSSSRIGERVLLCAMQYISDTRSACLGSEMNGCYAEYVSLRSSEAHAISSRLSDSELAAIPCAYSTAEGMVSRAGVSAGEKVLVTGASGGVGLAAVQLSRLRGADVTALVGAGKGDAVCERGAHRYIERGHPLRESLAEDSLDVVIDLVGGDITNGGEWMDLLRVLRRGGRYAVSGAIGGPIVSLDLRQLYLQDLVFYGCTAQGRDIFPRLLGYLEREQLRPLVARTFPLAEIHEAQRAFLRKDFVGKIVLLP